MKYKKILALTIVFFGLISFFSIASYSYIGFNEEEKKGTEPSYISMLFHKLSGKKPDFNLWAESSEKYIESTDLDKMAAKNVAYDQFDNFFTLLNIKEPIIISFTTQISDYSETNKGFFIDSFQPDLFFNYEYMGEHYAVIPNGIDNYQWFSVPEADIKFSKLNTSKENYVNLKIILQPKYADSKKTIRLGKNKYWMILTEVKDIELWSTDSNQLLWRGENASENNKLLGLYR